MNDKGWLDKSGDFVARVEPRYDSWFTESGEKKTPGIRLTLIVDEGPEEGAKIDYWGWLSPAAEDYTLKALAKAFGDKWDIDDIDALIGEKCRISVEMEQYGDKEPRAKIAFLNPLSGGGNASLPKEKLTPLLERLRSKSKAIAREVAQEEGRPAPRPQPHSTVRHEPDDIPWGSSDPKVVAPEDPTGEASLPF